MSEELIIDVDDLSDEHIFRTKKRKDYFIASTQMAQDERLCLETRGLLGYLLSKPPDWDTSMYDLKKNAKIKSYKIRRIMAEARLYGYIARIRVRDESGGQFFWITNVYSDPEENPYLSERDKPYIKARLPKKKENPAETEDFTSVQKSDTGEKVENSSRIDDSTRVELSTCGSATRGSATRGSLDSIHNIEEENIDRENIDSQNIDSHQAAAGAADDDNDSGVISLSPNLQNALRELGVYKSIWKELIPLLSDGWTEADMVALMDWQSASNEKRKFAASGFVSRMRDGERAPREYYDFWRRKLAGYWYPGKEMEVEAEAELEAEETTPENFFTPVDPVPEEAARAWVSVLDQLKMDMPRASFDTWVRDTVVASFDDGLLRIATRNSYARDWLENRMTSTVERLLIGILNQSVKVVFVVMQKEEEQT